MNIYEYDEEKTMRQFQEEGREAMLLEIVQNMHTKGQSVSEIADLLAKDEATIRRLIDSKLTKE